MEFEFNFSDRSKHGRQVYINETTWHYLSYGSFGKNNLIIDNKNISLQVFILKTWIPLHIVK